MSATRGLYVHIPFCDHICAYCDFARQKIDDHTVTLYLKALEKDFKQQNPFGIKTIYIGGGTPSSLKARDLESLFKIIKHHASNVDEFTIEVNPESLNLEKAQLMKQYGVNRVSMGLQVTQSHLLKLVERQHSFQDVLNAIDLLHEVGIKNISLDLMYGIPTQTLEDWKASLEVVLALPIQHISLYALTIEPGSLFNQRGYHEASIDMDADMYEMALDMTKKAGFQHYEVSNFAKPNYQSIHNKIYWAYDDFYGVGLSAAGKIGSYRYQQTRSMASYLKADWQTEVIELKPSDLEFEYIMMNLRLREGLSFKDYSMRFKKDFFSTHQESIKKLKSQGLIDLNQDYIYCTDKGIMLLHNVLEEFAPA